MRASLCMLMVGVLCSGCGSGSSSSAGVDAGEAADATVPVLPAHLVITADWVKGTLSYVDRDLMAIEAAKRNDAMPWSVDLTGYSPGPLALALTPDKTRLVVLASGGIFAGVGSVLLGGGEVPTGSGKVREYSLHGTAVTLDQTIALGEGDLLDVLGIAYDGKDTVFLTSPQKSAVLVVNLATRAWRTVDWEQKELGPAGIVVVR